MDISAKNIVITGGVGGIGIALVQHLLKHGAEVFRIHSNGYNGPKFMFLLVQNVALLDIVNCEETITKLSEDYPTKRILFHMTDVVSKTNLEAVFDEVVSKFKSIDCVIACAGVFDELNYERTVNINLV